VSISKKTTSNSKITPLHCASINPNDKYLRDLITKGMESSTLGYHTIDALQRKPIHFACSNETNSTLKYLIEECHSDPLECDKSKMNAFLFACQHGKLENVKYLMEKYPDIHQSKNKSRDTGLHLACTQGHVHVVKYLLEKQEEEGMASPQNTSKQTPLIIASKNGFFEIVKLLMEDESKLKIQNELKGDKFKKTALHHAVMEGHFEVSKYLVLKGFDVNGLDSSNNSVVHFASAFGYSSILSLLQTAGANLNTLSDWSTSPLSISLMKGHLKCSTIILNDPNVDVNFVDNQNKTMLHQLLQNKEGNFFKQIKFLIKEKKAKVSISSVDGESLLHTLSSSMIHEKDVEIAEMIISQEGGSLLVHQPDNQGMTPFLIACTSGNIPLVEFYLNKEADLCQLNGEKQNFLHLLHLHLNEFDLLKILNLILPTITTSIWKKLRSQYDSYGFTPLLLLFEKIQSSMTNRPITTPEVVTPGGFSSKLPSDENSEDEDGGSASNEQDESDELLDPSQDLNETNDTIMKENVIIPTGSNNSSLVDYMKILLENYSKDFNLQVKESSDEKKRSNCVGFSPIHFLSRHEIPNTPLLELLISHSFDVNLLDLKNRNPLHISFKTTKSIKGYDFDEILIQSGCDLNALDSQKRTPIHYIFIQSENKSHQFWSSETNRYEQINIPTDPIEIISNIFSQSNDTIQVNQKDIYGRTLLHEACAKGANTCSMFLIQQGALIEEEDEDKNTPLCLALLSK
jgi:ankyrin repeat protein